MEIYKRRVNRIDRLVNGNGHKHMIFAGVKFDSLRGVREYLKEMLLTHNEDDYITDFEFNFIFDCLLFTDYGNKLTNGLISIKLASRVSRIICLEYTDSYKKYIHAGQIFKSQTGQHHDNVMRAFFHSATFHKRPEANLSCHHANVPFAEIVNGFLDAKRLEWYDVKIEFDYTIRTFTLSDKELLNEWINYHDERATLEWMPKEEHNQLHYEEKLRNRKYGCRIRQRHKLRSMPPLSIDGKTLVNPIQKGRQYYIHPRVLMINTRRIQDARQSVFNED
jgi:hypothetical protein